jgi:predicted RNA-binding protein with EMAP domain
MTNYEMVAQWAATLNSDKAFNELQNLKLKYPWLKCDESLAFLERMNADLPKIANIVKMQEKQNLIHRKFVEVNQIADEAIVKAIASRYNIDI